MKRTVPAKLVGIAGRNTRCAVPVDNPGDMCLVSWPDIVAPVKKEPKIENNSCIFEFQALKPGRGSLAIRINGTIVAIPAVVFREKEFFLAMAISSNFHVGWDPLTFLMGDTPERLELSGHAWPKTRQLEKMYHTRNLPITWFVDKTVAAVAAQDIIRWHGQYGDDYGVMPSSFFTHTEVNYNTRKSANEALEFVKNELAGVQAQFPFSTELLAIDQWVGSIGTNYTAAGYELGMTGLWGIGWDHGTCDTSMYHRGCPWDMYKPDRSNFRIPAKHASSLWVFQWTTRDILSTMLYANGTATAFSTDPDDVRNCGIMVYQQDYYVRMFREYQKNMDKNDFYVFMVHQEDHDCHYGEDADYLRYFLDNISGDYTPATLGEISAWLNLKYAPAEHPAQALWLNDMLDCHQKLAPRFGVAGATVPADGEHFPPIAAYYGADAQWIIPRGKRVPVRWYDYTKRYPTAETGNYPAEALPDVVVHHERFERQETAVNYIAEIETDAAVAGLPLAVWGVPADILAVLKKTCSPRFRVIGEGLIISMDLEAGRKTYRIAL